MVLTMSVSSHIQMDFLLLAQKQLFLKTVKLHTSGNAHSTSNPYIVYVVIANKNSLFLDHRPKEHNFFLKQLQFMWA